MEPRPEPAHPYGIDNAGRQALRDDPEVIVRRPEPPMPFEPWVSVVGIDSVRDLIDRDDDVAATNSRS